MRLSPAARRIGSAASVLAAGLALGIAGNAGAAIYNPADTAQFESAITASNASIGVPDTIQLAAGITYSPTATVVVTDDLTIRGNPQLQQSGTVAPTIFQGAAIPAGNNFVRVAEGVSLTVNAVQTQSGGDGAGGFPSFLVEGDLVVLNSSFSGHSGNAINTSFAALAPTVTIVNSTIHANSQTGVFMTQNGELDMNLTTVTNNNQGGVVVDGNVDIRNSIIGQNTGAQCVGAQPGQIPAEINYVTDVDTFSPGDGGDCRIYDADGVNNITVAANTAASLGINAVFAQNGGPTRTRALLTGSSSRNSGDNANCSTVDARFFVRTDGLCDRGSFEFGSARDTTPPSCGVTAVRPGPPKQQDVGVQDLGSGLELITDVAITNGTVFIPPFTIGTLATTTLTATKTNQAQSTSWSFTARDVAGNTQDCR